MPTPFVVLTGPLIAGALSAKLQRSASPPLINLPRATIVVALSLTAMFAAQLAIPNLLPWLERSPALIEKAQLWRAVTALFVQDGGTAGAVFNLVILLVVGVIVEQRLGPANWSILYFGGAIITEFLALPWQPHGAGNSVACFALAGGMIAHDAGKTRTSVQFIVRLAGLFAGLALLWMRDIHGIGFLAGIVIEMALTIQRRPGSATAA